MEKEIWNPTTLMGPLPVVLVSCGTMENANVFTVAWTGIVNTKPAMTYISVQPSRLSHGMIESSGEFVINLCSADMVRSLDLCGVKSGREVNKMEKCSFHLQKMKYVKAPGIQECPICIECRVENKISLGSHDMFLSVIKAVHVRKDLIDSKGALQIEKADLISFAHGKYYRLTEPIGSFGFSVRKKTSRRKLTGNYQKSIKKALE